MQHKEGIQRRNYFRLRYPKKGCPLLEINDRRFMIKEVSENGMRVMMGGFIHIYHGLKIKGKVILHDESTVDIEGRVVRFDHREVIMELTQGFSFKLMVEEQGFIKQNYPDFWSRQRKRERAQLSSS